MTLDYVVQEHRAKRAGKHHDLRLERKDALASWAVPKGLPTKRTKSVLAIRTKEHTRHWLRFEGKIPKGKYGYGTVKIVSRGKYTPEEWTKKKIKFTIDSGELKGQKFVLIHLKEDKWIIKKVG